MFALHIDCNSFYASCEVSQNPGLQGKPVVVVNNNEAGGGVILALTKEAKELGLKRGHPVFQVRDVLEQHDVKIFPADHSKYRDISRRIVQTVLELDMVRDFHRYSIDEFFAALPEMKDDRDIVEFVGIIKTAIEQGTGIPVSCGIAPTYTLAKVATWYAKRYDGYHGICMLQEKNIEKALRGLPVNEVWGIGKRSLTRLKKAGVNTAYDFMSKPLAFIEKQYSIAGVRTWMELHGKPAISLSASPGQQTIMHSRTFTYMTSDKEGLATYLRSYAVAAASKLRHQRSVCRSVTVFANTNRHREDLEQYSNGLTVKLPEATADTAVIMRAVSEAFDAIYKPYYLYKRAGVVLGGIMPDEAVEQNLFSSQGETIRKHRRLMAAADDINIRFGMNKIKPASLIIPDDESKDE